MKANVLLLLILGAATAWTAATYRYECPKCHLIQEYGIPGIHKCPNDGWTMIPKNY
jgi:cytochrome c5